MLLLRLRLRTWLFGWGLHPEELRVLSGYRVRAFRAYAVMVLVLFAAIFVAIPGLQGYSTPINIRVREGIGLLVILLLLAIYLAVPALIYRRRAREATLVPEHLIGYCYRVAFNLSSSCFIRFGISAETAHWYAVPLEWEELISTAPLGTPFELWVLPVTGWVERLRRGGAEPREVALPAPDLRPLSGRDARGEASETPDDRDAETDAAEDDGATKAEARAMRRYARRAGVIWQESPKQLAGWGVVLVVIGLFACIVPAVLAAWVIPQVQRPGDRVAIAFLVALFEVLGTFALVLGMPRLLGWRHVRRLDTTQAEATGTVIAWTASAMLIKIRTACSSEQIFRLPPKLAHRIEDRGDLVRITYRPETGQVLDVRHVPAPVEALAADHGDV